MQQKNGFTFAPPLDGLPNRPELSRDSSGPGKAAHQGPLRHGVEPHHRPSGLQVGHHVRRGQSRAVVQVDDEPPRGGLRGLPQQVVELHLCRRGGGRGAGRRSGRPTSRLVPARATTEAHRPSAQALLAMSPNSARGPGLVTRPAVGTAQQKIPSTRNRDATALCGAFTAARRSATWARVRGLGMSSHSCSFSNSGVSTVSRSGGCSAGQRKGQSIRSLPPPPRTPSAQPPNLDLSPSGEKEGK